MCGCHGYGHGFRGGFHHGPFHCMPRAMTVQEEVEMLEHVKEALEDQLKNVNERLEKLKA